MHCCIERQQRKFSNILLLSADIQRHSTYSIEQEAKRLAPLLRRHAPHLKELWEFPRTGFGYPLWIAVRELDAAGDSDGSLPSGSVERPGLRQRLRGFYSQSGLTQH